MSSGAATSHQGWLWIVLKLDTCCHDNMSTSEIDKVRAKSILLSPQDGKGGDRKKECSDVPVLEGKSHLGLCWPSSQSLPSPGKTVWQDRAAAPRHYWPRRHRLLRVLVCPANLAVSAPVTAPSKKKWKKHDITRLMHQF